jgi:hypothetical protein
MQFGNRMNKRGWIRITEAVVAILIMASVLIVLYTNETPQISYSEYVYELQVRLLTDVADTPLLRNATLYSNETYLRENYFDLSIPQNFNYNITICDLSADSCSVDTPSNREVYVEDRIISSNLEKYAPKLLRLYIWEKD